MIPRTDLPERSSMENGYRITLGGKFGDKIETRSNPHKPVFEFFLTKDGRKDGCVRIWSHLGTMPVWYDADRDILFYLSEDGSIQERQGAELARMFERNMEETTEQGEEVRGLILSVPYLTTDGATSFEPWLEKIQKGPVIVVNTKQLNEDIISAFVDRITGA